MSTKINGTSGGYLITRITLKKQLIIFHCQNIRTTSTASWILAFKIFPRLETFLVFHLNTLSFPRSWVVLQVICIFPKKPETSKFTLIVTKNGCLAFVQKLFFPRYKLVTRFLRSWQNFGMICCILPLLSWLDRRPNKISKNLFNLPRKSTRLYCTTKNGWKAHRSIWRQFSKF